MERLTKRELVVLEQAARGLSAAQSGRESHHEEQTIKFHRTHVMRKLGAKNIAHAVALAYKQGILRNASERVPVVEIDGVRFEPR